MTNPLVTVICLCYNQSMFVQEALASVYAQTYGNVELIIVDDASTDNSAEVIHAFLRDKKFSHFIALKANLGSCKAFNIALKQARGTFVIDLAADDVLLPTRIEMGVQQLMTRGLSFGVHFSDADIINEAGKHLYFHSDKFPHDSIPQGDIYQAIIERYFICSPTMMFRKELLDALGGYDESLSYEDFDLWVRSSRSWQYCYSPEVLIQRRIVSNSLSKKQFAIRSKHQSSTFSICEKIVTLNKNKAEQRALSNRILYEIRLNLKLLNWKLAMMYFGLWRKNRLMKYAE